VPTTSEGGYLVRESVSVGISDGVRSFVKHRL
jgi:hypothetical protein